MTTRWSRLSATGTSSAPDQPSFEDERLGGLLTHFFMEGMREAHADGPGITLERIWHYARERTVEYTGARGQRQTPEQYVTELKSAGPLYFSFPERRSATLVLERGVRGNFLLSYADGSMTELIPDSNGQARELAVYPGYAHLMLMESGQLLAREPLTLAPRGRVVVTDTPTLLPRAALGERAESLWSKGFDGTQLTATATAPATSVMISPVYSFTLASSSLLVPRHGAGARARFDHGWLHASVYVGYAYAHGDFSAWSVQAHGLAAGARAGVAHDWGVARFSAGLDASVARMSARYDNGKARDASAFLPGAAITVLLPRTGTWAGFVDASGGLAYAPGVAEGSDHVWHGWGQASIGLAVRLW